MPRAVEASLDHWQRATRQEMAHFGILDAYKE